MIPETIRLQEVLAGWLTSRLEVAPATWVRERQTLVRAGDKAALQLAFGMTPRKVRKADLALSPVELAAAEVARPGWDPRGWTVDQAVRSLLILSFPCNEPEAFVGVLDQLFGVGDVGELVALYQSLPLLPHPAMHVLRAAEGIRTNIKSVFCSPWLIEILFLPSSSTTINGIRWF